MHAYTHTNGTYLRIHKHAYTYQYTHTHTHTHIFQVPSSGKDSYRYVETDTLLNCDSDGRYTTPRLVESIANTFIDKVCALYIYIYVCFIYIYIYIYIMYVYVYAHRCSSRTPGLIVYVYTYIYAYVCSMIHNSTTCGERSEYFLL